MLIISDDVFNTLRHVFQNKWLTLLLNYDLLFLMITILLTQKARKSRLDIKLTGKLHIKTYKKSGFGSANIFKKNLPSRILKITIAWYQRLEKRWSLYFINLMFNIWLVINSFRENDKSSVICVFDYAIYGNIWNLRSIFRCTF